MHRDNMLDDGSSDGMEIFEVKFRNQQNKLREISGSP